VLHFVPPPVALVMLRGRQRDRRPAFSTPAPLLVTPLAVVASAALVVASGRTGLVAGAAWLLAGLAIHQASGRPSLSAPPAR
jgi:hypothetical protein